MIRSFTIKNFRCFRDLTIELLERVNLIAGKNNTGKTSLLEALLLHANSFDLVRVNPQLRDMQQLWKAKDTIEGYFFKKQIDTPFEIHSLRQDEDALSSIGYINKEPSKAFSLAIDAKRGRGEETSIVGTITVSQEGGAGGSSGLVLYPCAVLESASKIIEPSTVELFSRLEEIGRLEKVILALRILEPRLCTLTILVKNGVPLIYGDIGLGRMLPIQLMGEGVVRLTLLLLSIADVPGGIVLVDEIENGLHYSVMTKVWQAIGEAARKNDVQVFATTHSWECIRYAHEAFSAAETYDFRLHRLDRIGDDIRAVTYDREMLDTALMTGLEVR